MSTCSSRVRRETLFQTLFQALFRLRPHGASIASRLVALALSLGLWSIATTPATAAPAAALGYTPKYPSTFQHFGYVNPNAPRGGEFSVSVMGNFQNLNPFLLKGIPAAGLATDLVFETLMEQSLDEPYSLYAHLARDVALAPDKLSVTFKLDPAARFSNGDPVTAADVKFSFDTLMSKQAHPRFRFYWADIKGVEALDAHTVRFNFAKVNPELFLIAAQIPIFSRKWVGDKPFDQVTMTTPIGSGPYRLARYDLGKQVVYERNPDYWARDRAERRGMFNFDRVVFKYYLDDTVILEAFKAGEFGFLLENNSKRWARDYNGPQFKSGRIKRTSLRHHNDAGMQGFVFNTRRPLFKDARVRRAITLAFDFDWSNRNLFYNQYTRCNSYFSNSELAATGVPEGEELKLLEPYRQQLPAEVFTVPWAPPTTTPPHSLRENLRLARALLKEAGWHLDGERLVNARGEPFEFEIIIAQAGFDRIFAPFARNLAKLGIAAHYRTIDTALFQRRTDIFDFDMTVDTMGQSQSPGNELMNLWHSSTANQEGSSNLIGINNPVIDALIGKVIYAPDRKHLVTAVHALDRVMQHYDFVVPNWYIATHRIAYWDRYGYPATLPLYFGADTWAIKTWWAK